jgi:oligopeptide transport system substrate-binding protein
MISISRKTLISVTSALLLVASLSCTKKNKADYNLDVSETLRWDIMTEPPTLDWTKSADTTSARIQDALMDGLTKLSFQSEDVETVPALATSWESSKDMKTWTFTLRQDVKWSDGVPFTAQQVLDGWERLLNPKTGAEYANFLFNIKNGQKYFEGKITDFSEVGVKINEKGQIVVQLETPQSFFPTILVHHSTWPVRKDIIAKYGDKWTEPGNMVTLGAYKLKIWDHDKAVLLERNEDYYGKKAQIKYILGRVIHERSTAVNMFKKGEIDALDELPAIEISNLKNMKEYKSGPQLAMYYYGMNISKPPFDNVKVRRALSLAIDREEVNKILGGTKISAYSIVPPGIVGHDPTIGLRFDPEQAKKLLDEAGYKDRSKMPKIQLGFNTSENHARIAENVQAQLKKNLGIDIELVNEEWKTYIKSLQAKNYQMYRMGWVADYPDADTFISLFVTNGGNNHTQWGNKRYDELIKKGVSDTDKEKRKQIYAEAQKIINEDEVPIIPIYYYRTQTLVNERVQNYPSNVMYKFNISEASLVK